MDVDKKYLNSTDNEFKEIWKNKDNIQIFPVVYKLFDVERQVIALVLPDHMSDDYCVEKYIDMISQMIKSELKNYAEN